MGNEFDRKIERRGSGALKTDALKERFGREDLQSMWVADMDFATPDCVMESIRRRLEHPVLGYGVLPADYKPSIIDWEREHHGVEISPEWLTYIPGVVKGIGMALNFFLREGDKVVIQPPVYHPFRLVPSGNHYEVVENPLRPVFRDGVLEGYEMDFGHLERVLDGRCRVLILSNPHNPAGVCWDRDTLCRLAEVCARHGVMVISDEIHADMTLWGERHIPFRSVSEEAASISLTFGAPSKTFNMPGIVTSWCVVSNKELREPFYEWLSVNEFDDPPLLSPIATIAAYREGDGWRREMLRYVEGNILHLVRMLSEEVPEIRMLRPAASFLVWLDCHGLGKRQEELVRFFIEECGLALNDGAMFGTGGEGYMRMNVATPRENITRAVGRIRDALRKG